MRMKRYYQEGVMNIFKKILAKLKPKAQQENSCWYNNYQQSQSSGEFNAEMADMGAPSSCELSCTKSIAQR